MKRRSWDAAWEKVRDEGRCRVTGSEDLVDPAHVIPRSRVGPPAGEDPRNIVPLERLTHMAYDAGNLDLLPYLTREEQTYAVELVGMAEAYRRVTGTRLAA
jgi:hypothetical protein